MEKFVIEGGVPLSGTITPAGNKNGALPILAACLLTDDEVILRNVPRISDVEAMVTLLEMLGAQVEWLGPDEVRIDAATVDSTAVDAQLAERIRASFLLAGPLLARFGQRQMPPPGGDVIGRRRLDPHLDAFRALGATVDNQHREIRLLGPAAGPASVRLPDGRAVGDGDRERAHGGRPDARHDRDPQRRLRAPRPGPGPDAGRRWAPRSTASAPT